ncbi:MAG: hypothetical protein PHH28_01910 [Desulfuromonadaceae bacterium]|nr:hypothetical protein [Desulfuromonadaceae bacterium]
MKNILVMAVICCCTPVFPSFAAEGRHTPLSIPPEAIEQLKKMLPPGTRLPSRMNVPKETSESGATRQTYSQSPLQEETATSQPSSSSATATSPIGSGRTLEQREAALAAVNAELELLALILPQKADASSKDTILKIAGERNSFARKKFGPAELSAYAQAVLWDPRFDGKNPNADKAREYSLLVSAATNYFSEPYFIMALASAVFSLDPQSTANANNFASAVVAAGERLYPGPEGVKKLVPYRAEAESIFRYALAISMKNDAWTEESFTAILNLGNLYIDIGKLHEARSLFQVARKLKPFSWDAALGMAAYFHAIGQSDKALAILEDPRLDKPAILMVMKRAAKVLEKSDKYADLPPDTSEEKFAEGIKVMNSEPITTAADFAAQIDQSERNKMRYFIEHLRPEGSFSAPKINKLTQYASVKAISSPQGESALKDFGEMVGLFTMTASASTVSKQMEWLSRMGLNIDPGVDLDDVAKHPEKYEDRDIDPEVKVSGMETFMANIEEISRQGDAAQRDLATGKTASSITVASQIDPFFTILQIDAEQYADPVNIIIQKYNFAVHNRKENLYKGYLYAVNKRTREAVNETLNRYQIKKAELQRMKAKEEAELEKRRRASSDPEDVEWRIMRHKIHTDYFNRMNDTAESAFGSAANVASTAYVQKVKPMAEAYYYDLIRHVSLISDPDVRKQKDAELRSALNSALGQGLQNVLGVYGAFSYSDDWDCECDLEALLKEREAEQVTRDEEENARIMRNKGAKARFDSGEIPESTPLWKKLDGFGTDLNIPFIPFLSGRISCARTYVKLNTDVLPIPNIGKLFGSMTRSEFTGATKYDGGVSIGISKDFKAGSVTANFGVSGSVSTDGNWNVRDSSITPNTGLSVQVGKVGVSVNGQMTFGPNGEVRDSDFSAGISQDMKNGFGMSGKASFEASTKMGCTLSGKVTDSIMPSDASSKDVAKSPWEKIQGDGIDGHYGESFRERPVTDKFTKKELWSGKLEFLKPK